MKKLAMTYFFNWYNYPTREHFDVANNSGTGLPVVDYFATHPTESVLSFSPNSDWQDREPFVASPTFSRELPQWYLSEMQKIKKHGIDFILFDYWGYPDPVIWPQSELNAVRLGEAYQLATDNNLAVPLAALFLETVPFSTDNSGGLDLTTDEGGDKLFVVIDAFFSKIPKSRWAKIDDKALVMFYMAGIPGLEIGNRGLRRAKQLFVAKYNVELLFAGNKTWKAKAPAQIDLVCSWGAGAQTLPIITKGLDIAQISPGYRYFKTPVGSDSREPSDTKYENAWKKFRESDIKLVAIETWNEYHESSAIRETHEFGRDFCITTNQQIGKWKKD